MKLIQSSERHMECAYYLVLIPCVYHLRWSGGLDGIDLINGIDRIDCGHTNSQRFAVPPE